MHECDCYKKKDEIAKPRIYCPEKLPVWWYCEYITGPGEYRCQFKVNGFNGCCKFDSVLKVEVLPFTATPSIYFIGCANEVYYDSITKTKYQDCLFNKEILLKKSSSIYRCDSTYLLNTYYPSFTTEFQHNCDSGRLEIQASIRDLSSYCGHNLKMNLAIDGITNKNRFNYWNIKDSYHCRFWHLLYGIKCLKQTWQC